MKITSASSISITLASAIPTMAIFSHNGIGSTRGGVALSSNNGGIATGSFTSNNLGGLPGGFTVGRFPSGSSFGSFFNNQPKPPPPPQQPEPQPEPQAPEPEPEDADMKQTKPGHASSNDSDLISKDIMSSSSDSGKIIKDPTNNEPNTDAPDTETNANSLDAKDTDTIKPADDGKDAPSKPNDTVDAADDIETPKKVEVSPIEVNIGASKGGSGTSFKDIGGTSVYVRKFAAYGFIDRVCVNIDEFCNDVENGDPSAFISCYAARQAVSQVRGAYSFEGRLRVGAGRQGVINAIDLKTEANAAALALSFSDAGSSIQTQATIDVGALAVSGSGLSNAEALAVSNSTAQAASVAYAASLGSSGSKSFTNTQVRVRGDRINLFEGFVTSAAGSFALSGADSEALASSAAEAYADVIAVARRVANETQGETFFAGIYQDADARSGAFGKAVAESVGAVGVTFTFGATISGTDDDNVEIDFGGGTAASVACG